MARLPSRSGDDKEPFRLCRLPAILMSDLFTPVETLTEAQAREELDRLSAELARHDALYYADAAPEISDADYDELKRRALAIET
ncbi:MAG TPA: hypothetical protein DEB60_04825, partial [Brevundimonas sp.]|nr:hypothetical protein [Brevundimonas sp.]